MKAILEFDLDNPDDKEAHLRCIKSTDMASVLFEFTANSRKRIINRIESKDAHLLKHNPDIDFIIQLVFQEFNGLMEGNDVNIDELIS